MISMIIRIIHYSFFQEGTKNREGWRILLAVRMPPLKYVSWVFTRHRTGMGCFSRKLIILEWEMVKSVGETSWLWSTLPCLSLDILGYSFSCVSCHLLSRLRSLTDGLPNQNILNKEWGNGVIEALAVCTNEGISHWYDPGGVRKDKSRVLQY